MRERVDDLTASGGVTVCKHLTARNKRSKRAGDCGTLFHYMHYFEAANGGREDAKHPDESR